MGVKKDGTTGMDRKVSVVVDFRSILSTILYQILECLADARWELSRMAQQV